MAPVTRQKQKLLSDPRSSSTGGGSVSDYEKIPFAIRKSLEHQRSLIAGRGKQLTIDDLKIDQAVKGRMKGIFKKWSENDIDLLTSFGEIWYGSAYDAAYGDRDWTALCEKIAKQFKDHPQFVADFKTLCSPNLMLVESWYKKDGSNANER